VQCLLDSGADINRPNVSGATPLYFACRYKFLTLKQCDKSEIDPLLGPTITVIKKHKI